MRKKLVFAIPTVGGRKENLVAQTIASLISNMDVEDKTNCIIYVFDADLEHSTRVEELKEKYQKEIKDGLMIFSKTSADLYPSMPDLESNKPLYWRTKQNIDFSILLDRASPLADYLVLLEDDLVTTKKVVKKILNDISYFSHYDWVVIKTCSVMAIGNVYKRKDCNRLSSFIQSHYLEEPVDWLQSNFIDQEKSQGRFYCNTPRSLFLHVGMSSSLDTKSHSEYKPENFEAFYIHDLAVGHFGFLIKPLVNAYYFLKSKAGR